MEQKIKAIIEKLVVKGYTDARFAKFDHADYFKSLLARKNITAVIQEKIGNVTTVDYDPKMKISRYFQVTAMKSSAHKVLGKFI